MPLHKQRNFWKQIAINWRIPCSLYLLHIDPCHSLHSKSSLLTSLAPKVKLCMPVQQDFSQLEITVLFWWGYCGPLVTILLYLCSVASLKMEEEYQMVQVVVHVVYGAASSCSFVHVELTVRCIGGGCVFYAIDQQNVASQCVYIFQRK